MGENRNLFLAIGAAIIILIGYQTFVLEPAARRAQAERARVEAAAAETASGTDAANELLPSAADTRESASAPAASAPASEEVSRAEALARSARVTIDTPALTGSIALRGARFDDLSLREYRQTTDDDSPIVTLLSPVGAANAYYIVNGWTATGGLARELPGAATEWSLAEGERLTFETPVTLGYTSPSGLEFRRTITVDDHYLFTVTDRVANNTGAPVDLQAYAAVRRFGLPEDYHPFFISHEGFVGSMNGVVLRKYKRMRKDGSFSRESTGGWLAIADKYWMAAIIPSPNATLTGEYRAVLGADDPLYEANYLEAPFTINEGETIEKTARVFAGAKIAEVLSNYEAAYGVDKFNFAIDWGNFWFLTKPFFLLLDYFGKLTGNFGLAILALVVLIKAAMFPLANASYKSMARMKQLQPKVAELRERFKADAQRQQQEMMALYQREKVNPLAGCLPLFVQIPVFFALYKTLFTTIEMRQAPFFGWLQDLSARDSTNMWNLFGLLPFDPGAIPFVGGVIGGTGFLALGVLPLLYGVSMAAMQTLNPPPPDPAQQRIFALMPWFFMFILAPFAAGLLVYWIWNNILSFTQQYVIMRRQGVETPIGTFLAKRWRALRDRGKPPDAGG